MVKFECAICCNKFTRKNLYSLCSSCNSDDKRTCATCLSKLVKIKGIEIDSPRLTITAMCPWCRGTIPQHTIIANRFSKTYQYYRRIYYQHVLATQLLTMDRSDLASAVRHFRHAPAVAPVIYRAWYAQRRLRPTSLDVQTQAEYHNRASDGAREVAASLEVGEPARQRPPEGDWEHDTTGVIDS